MTDEMPQAGDLSEFIDNLRTILMDPSGRILVAFITGMACMLLLQALCFWQYFKRSSSHLPPKWCYKPITMPELLRNLINVNAGHAETCLWLNLLAHFLFNELKDDPRLRRFLTKMIRLELELILKSRTGVLLDELNLRDLNLGDKIPIVTSAKIEKCDLVGEEIQTIAFKCALNYEGGMEISFDAALPFNNSAFLCIKVLGLKGNIRLQFSYLPYSHWSVAFIEDPQLDLDIIFQIGNKYTKLKNVIASQIKKLIRRNHTLPNYKIRYEPFFRRPEPIRDALSERIKLSNGEILGRGILTVTVVQASRLPLVAKGGKVYCTVSVDMLTWQQKMMEKRKKRQIVSVDIAEKKEESLGLVLKDEYLPDQLNQSVVVEKINNTSKYIGLKKNDIVIFVNYQSVNSAKHAMKLIRTSKDRVHIKVERDIGSIPADYPSCSTWASYLSEDNHTDNQTQETSKVSAVVDPKWEDCLTFTVTHSTVYLNVCVWSSEGEKTSLPNETDRREKPNDIMLGFATIDLDDIFLSCLLTTINCTSRRLMLKHGHVKVKPELAAQYAHLTGYDPSMMYGDIFLHFHFLPSDFVSNEAPVTYVDTRSTTEDSHLRRLSNVSKARTISRRRDGIEANNTHQFQKTNFLRATFCEFCENKIWMKNAFKCRLCGMVCHSKCLVNCLVKTICSPEGPMSRHEPEVKWSEMAKEKGKAAYVQPHSASSVKHLVKHVVWKTKDKALNILHRNTIDESQLAYAIEHLALLEETTEENSRSPPINRDDTSDSD